MSLILLGISRTPYTLELTLELDGKKKMVSILKEDGEALDLPPCPAPLPDEICRELPALEEREKLVKKALSYLEKRPYSKKGLFAKLIEKGAPPPEAKFAVLAVAKYGYFHEKEDIGQVLCKMAKTGYGPKKAKRYLLQKGYSQKDIDFAEEELLEKGVLDWEKAKTAALEKIRSSKKEIPQNKVKSMLAYLGFEDDEW